MPTQYRVVISPEALSDLERILDYIAQDSPANAVKAIDHLLDEIQSLEQFPGRFADEKADPSLRSMPSPPFRVLYEIVPGHPLVRVLAVQHGAQQDWRGRP